MRNVLPRGIFMLSRGLAMLLLVAASSTTADEATDSTEMLRQEILERFVEGICYEEFVECIGIEQSTCSDAAASSAAACPIDQLHDAIAALPPGLPGPSEDMAQAGAEFGTCLANGWRERLGIDLNDFPQCEIRRGGAAE